MPVFSISGIEFDSNIYIINGKVPTIIDTGTGFHSKEIISRIQKIIDPQQIRQIVLTHEHFDHVGGTCDLLKATLGKARISAHRDSVQKLKEGKSTFAEMLGGTMPKVEVDEPLIGGEEILLGDASFEVLATPGHSQGCLCLYGRQDQSLFSGDTVFADGGFGRYDFPGGDLQSLIRSIERLSALKIKNLYPGHGPIVEGTGDKHVALALQNIRSLM